MAILIESAGPARGREYALGDAECVLGRQVDCNIHEVFAGDQRVSRRHTRIVCVDDVFYVEDLGSRNGTVVNGNRITARVPLADGDQVTICGIEFTFFRERPAEDAAASSVRRNAVDSAELVDGRDSSSIVATANVSLAGKDTVGPELGAERKLAALLDMLSNLGNSLDVDVVLDSLLDGLFRVFPHADRAFVGLREELGDSVVPRAVRFRHASADERMTISRTIVRQVMDSGQAILCSDAQSDARFRASQSIYVADIRSFMCAPLIDSQGEVWGLIQLDALDSSFGFTKQDLQVLASIAPQTGIALKYAQIHERELQQQALKRDLELASRVQRTLLPSQPPRLDNFEFFAYYESAREVGGDYYDYVPLRDGRLAVVVADVAGKGVPAALLMAKLSGELRTYLLSEPTPAAAVMRMNRSLAGDGSPFIRFITLALIVIDSKESNVDVVNAGHVMPLLRRENGTVEEAAEECCGVPLGVVSVYEYETGTVELNRGDILVLLTDGITEATRTDAEFYGKKRLRDQLERAGSSAEEIGRAILQDVTSFAAGHPQSDDTCLICVRRTQ